MSDNNNNSTTSSTKRKRNNENENYNDNIIDLINDDNDTVPYTNGNGATVMTVDLTNDDDDYVNNVINVVDVINIDNVVNDIVNDEVIAQNLQEEEYAAYNVVNAVNSEDMDVAKRYQEQYDQQYIDDLLKKQYHEYPQQQNHMFGLLRPMVSSSSSSFSSFSIIPHEENVNNNDEDDDNNDYNRGYEHHQPQMRNLEDSYTDTIKVLETLVRRVLNTADDDIITMPDSVRLVNNNQISNEIAYFVTTALNHSPHSVTSTSSSSWTSSSSSLSSHNEIQKFLWKVHTHYSLWSFQYHMQQKHVNDGSNLINVFQSKKHLESFAKAKWWFKELIESLSVNEKFKNFKEGERITYNINNNYLKSTHFICKMIRMVINQYETTNTSDNDDIFMFDFSYISWGNDNDYSEFHSDFINARLYNLNPFNFLGKGLCIIVDR